MMNKKNHNTSESDVISLIYTSDQLIVYIVLVVVEVEKSCSLASL